MPVTVGLETAAASLPCLSDVARLFPANDGDSGFTRLTHAHIACLGAWTMSAMEVNSKGAPISSRARLVGYPIPRTTIESFLSRGIAPLIETSSHSQTRHAGLICAAGRCLGTIGSVLDPNHNSLGLLDSPRWPGDLKLDESSSTIWLWVLHDTYSEATRAAIIKDRELSNALQDDFSSDRGTLGYQAPNISSDTIAGNIPDLFFARKIFKPFAPDSPVWLWARILAGILLILGFISMIGRYLDGPLAVRDAGDLELAGPEKIREGA